MLLLLVLLDDPVTSVWPHGKWDQYTWEWARMKEEKASAQWRMKCTWRSFSSCPMNDTWTSGRINLKPFNVTLILHSDWSERSDCSRQIKTFGNKILRTCYRKTITFEVVSVIPGLITQNTTESASLAHWIWLSWAWLNVPKPCYSLLKVLKAF